MAKDSNTAYQTIIKYSDKGFYPNKNYMKKNVVEDNLNGKCENSESIGNNNKKNEKTVVTENVATEENVPGNETQKTISSKKTIQNLAEANVIKDEKNEILQSKKNKKGLTDTKNEQGEKSEKSEKSETAKMTDLSALITRKNKAYLDERARASQHLKSDEDSLALLRGNNNMLYQNSYHIALTACGAAGDTANALNILFIMAEQGYNLRSDSMNAVLNAVSSTTFP